MPRVVVNSEFFMDQVSWDVLQEQILPELLSNTSKFRAWSAGCSIGKEPYSLEMLLQRWHPPEKHFLLATDYDEEALCRAKEGGPFSESDLRNVPDSLRASCFIQSGVSYYIHERLTKSITFRCHNLLEDAFEKDFDLILYRNVEPCISYESRHNIANRLRSSLRQGGVLFVGATDTAIQGLERIGHTCLFRKT